VIALAFEPVIPVPVKQMIVGPRFHLAFFFLFVPLLVALVIFAVGINGGNECDCFSVGRPPEQIGAGGELRQSFRFAAPQRKHIDLRRAVTSRDKGKGFSVWRPGGRIVPAALGDLQRLAAGSGDNRDVAHVAVGFEVRRRCSKGHPLPVARYVHRTDAVQLDQIIKRHRVLHRCLRTC